MIGQIKHPSFNSPLLPNPPRKHRCNPPSQLTEARPSTLVFHFSNNNPHFPLVVFFRSLPLPPTESKNRHAQRCTGTASRPGCCSPAGSVCTAHPAGLARPPCEAACKSRTACGVGCGSTTGSRTTRRRRCFMPRHGTEHPVLF